MLERLRRPRYRSSVVHSVYFYDNDAALIHRLCAIIDSALTAGNSALMVITAPHCVELLKELRRRRIEIRSAELNGKLMIFDARMMLDTFLVNGRPDRELFEKNVASLIDKVKTSDSEAGAGLSVFGEMVALLWAEGNRQGAIELEALWNEALNKRAFYLHCAYSRSTFVAPDDPEHIADICKHHSHVLGTAAPAA